MSKLEEKEKRSSLRISLVLIGSVAFASCGEDGTRNVYNSQSDCLAENSASDCEAVSSDSSDYSHSHRRYYGAFIPYRGGSSISSLRTGSKSVSVARATRGGFGGSSGFHSSGS
ncbi:MAG TPA: hypothetical protein PKM65_08555 [Spirochaetota bacterium]|nr:hypothetical protein [Spirochaetota bacterium]HNT12521.1 hypothetical protein [Spirochaetota bacterium]HNV47380.1 hypothetical protein [Spirochaetota bacterium]HOS39780.1 hypothetical protein [Spirochaetota bacterium]HPI22984.1 hypothetical protein [Spirochaetota bacterium]